MKRKLLPNLLLILAPLQLAAAIDLTPTVREYKAEGLTFRQLTFKDGVRQAVYEPPRLWSCRGSGDSLRLVPPNIDRADAVIQVVGSGAGLKLDDKGMAALKEQFLSTLPPGSQSVTVLSEEQNPVGLENSISYGITASYRAAGEIYIRSVIIVARGDQQLTFKFTAPKSDFDGSNRSFRQSIYSWKWVEPVSPKSADQTPAQTVVSC